MTDEELLDALRTRRAEVGTRIDMTTVPAPPLFPPCSEVELTEAERSMGLHLPRLLKLVYANVGDGGFGPGAGLLGLASGYHLDGHHRLDVRIRRRVRTVPAVRVRGRALRP
jgi:hypothetical protein